jgi:hypothetical protein
MSPDTKITLAGCGFVAVQLLTTAFGLRQGRHDTPPDDELHTALVEPNPVTGRVESKREIDGREMRF